MMESGYHLERVLLIDKMIWSRQERLGAIVGGLIDCIAPSTTDRSSCTLHGKAGVFQVRVMIGTLRKGNILSAVNITCLELKR